MRELAVRFDWLRAADVTSQIAPAEFLGTQIVLFFIRTLPLQKAAGIVPRVAAIVGANLQLLFLTIPRVDHRMTVKMLSFFLTTGGVAASIFCILYLGRSFSILPQARGLVTSGPYRFTDIRSMWRNRLPPSASCSSSQSLGRFSSCWRAWQRSFRECIMKRKFLKLLFPITALT